MATIRHHEIKGAWPGKVYSGLATGISGPGFEIIVLAPDHATLRQVAKVFDPTVTLDPEAIFPVSLIHDKNIIREDDL